MSFTSAVSSPPNFKPVWVPPTTTIHSLPSKVCSFPLLQGKPTGFHGKVCRVRFSRNQAVLASKVFCSARSENDSVEGAVEERSVSVILLAGGKGKKMGASMPKQYLPLLGQPIALYSLYTFAQMVEVKEIVVVCDPSYRDIFEEAQSQTEVVLKFALPGKERQDSVYSGLQEVDSNSALVCVHDSARPLLLSADVRKVLKNGAENGAAVLGVPVKATIKERGT